jgi:hypothetical protein
MSTSSLGALGSGCCPVSCLLPDRPPPGCATRRTTLAATAAVLRASGARLADSGEAPGVENASSRSVWFRNSVRGAAGLAIAMFVAQ